MEAFPGNTIAALCYARDPDLDFHRLVTELSDCVGPSGPDTRIDLSVPDIAVCDSADLRIGLSRVRLDREFPGSLAGRHYPACLVLSVGPDGSDTGHSQHARYARVRSDLIARVQDSADVDRVLMFERAGPLDIDMLDEVVDDIRAHLDKVLCPQRDPVSDVAGPALATRPSPAAAPVPTETRNEDAPRPDDIIQGLAVRLEAELDRLEGARRALEEAEAASQQRPVATMPIRQIVPRFSPNGPNAIKGLFRMPGVITAKRNAYPDYEHMPANVDERPLLHRAAVNALNVTVMTIALPVGAALLTMSVLGREDMLFSSRVTAVTGVGVGLYNTGVAQSLFALFS